MPAAASWFQVNCPACTAALQVRLTAGETSVACSEALSCHEVFTVKVLPAMLKAAEAAPPIVTRHVDKEAAPRRAVTTYNLYIKSEGARLRGGRTRRWIAKLLGSVRLQAGQTRR